VEVAKLHALTIQKIQYYAKHRLGIAENPNSHSDSSPFLGSGQGAADSPARWGFISDALIRAFKKVSHPAIIQSPISEVSFNQQLQAFVDDTRTLLINPSSSTPNLYTKLLSMICQDSQGWERLLYTAAGKLELPKCKFGLIRWQYDSQGTALLCPSTGEPLRLEDSETHRSVDVPQLDPAEAYKYLGIHVALDGNMVALQKALQEKCQQFLYIFSQSHLSQTNMQLCYRTVFSPSVKYVLPATSLDPDFLDKVQRPIIALVLSKLGFNQHMPREVVLAPLHFGGLGLIDLIVEQGIAQTLLVLSHIRSKSSVYATIRVLLESHQISAGLDSNPLETTEPCHYIHSPWVHSLQFFLHKCNAKICIPDLHTTSPLRIKDTLLMQHARNLQFSPTEMVQINNCRLYLQILYLSEITSDTGTHILECAIHGHHTPQGTPVLSQLSQTTIKWPTQPRPDSTTWSVWKRFIQSFITSDSHHRLRQPLGAWIKQQRPKQIYNGVGKR
jgi:hypothetical protein